MMWLALLWPDALLPRLRLKTHNVPAAARATISVSSPLSTLSLLALALVRLPLPLSASTLGPFVCSSIPTFQPAASKEVLPENPRASDQSLPPPPKIDILLHLSLSPNLPDSVLLSPALDIWRELGRSRGCPLSLDGTPERILCCIWLFCDRVRLSGLIGAAWT